MLTRRSFALVALTLAVAAPPAMALQPTGPKLKFELTKDAAGEFRWRLKAANNLILATSGQGYKAKADAMNVIDKMKDDLSGGKYTFESYQDAKQEYRWRLKATNGQTVAATSEGYKAKGDADHAIDLIKAGAKDATVDDQTK